MAYAVEMLDICKYFPGVRANDHVNFKVREGEIHGLLGENGAGKSTLMNVLFGLFQADSGTIMINGEEKVIDSPKKAIDMGIEMIHQHFMLVGNLTVAENIILGEEPTGKFNILDRTEIAKKVSDLLERIGFRLELGDMIEDISVGLQQRVEILKALYREARILILDEPTAVLTPQEADELFETIKRLKSEGVTIIFITHKLREIIAICDRVTVLRHGKVIGTVNTSETTRSNLANMMVGREVLFKIDKKAVSPGKVILDVENVTALDDRHLRALNNISFNVREGEIVGIAGVQGNGQSQLIEVITGLRAAKTGKIIIDGITTTDFSPRKVLEEGVAHIPEDRQKRGLILPFSIKENLILGIHHNPIYSNFTVLKDKEIKKFAKNCIDTFEIKVTSIDSPVSNMSGGNMQKVILGRELLGRDQKLIIAGQPTRGLDVGVIEYVHQTLLQMRNQGQAILLVSTELDEIRTLADRAYVMFGGTIMAEIDPATISDHDISLLMAGIPLENGKN